ncbi:MAG: ABC transporter substrate-binding protein [Eubacteriaceae bacterium]|jgi:peptide/nickel transport system substrate-binding protein|nr:ABC transporter substrate-binding protein [Eubacteriaceae bacterium]
MRRKVLLLALILILAISLIAGCGGGTSSGGKKDDGSIVFGSTNAVMPTLDPAVDWVGWYPVRYGVGETLFKLDESLQPAPWLAESYENIDPNTWKITLKDKATFSNGEKVTGEKVVESLKRVGEINSRAAYIQDIDFSVEGNTITMKTPEPNATLIYNFCDPYATIVDVANTEDFENAPICTGPFKIESFDPETKAVMVKNENYWDGEVKSQSVTYIDVSDFNTLAMSLETGEVDVALELSPEAAESLKDKEGIVVSQTVQPRTYQVYFNMETMPDKAVREAVMTGIDKQAICEEQLKGAVTSAVGAFPEFTPYNDKDLKARIYDIEKAKQILADAGYADSDGDGIVEKDGKPLTLQLSIYKRLAMESIGTEIQAQLKKIGINVELKVFEKSTYFEPGDFDIGMYSIVTMPIGEPSKFLADCMMEGETANYGHYNNPQVNDKLKELQQTFDEDKRIALVAEIQQTAIDDAAFDYIGFNNMMVAAKESVQGFTTHANDYYHVTKDLTK